MEPEQLLAELDNELRSVLGMLASFKPATEDVVLADESGRVEILVSPQAALKKVTVAPNWAEEIETDALAPIIAETIGRAQAKAFGLELDETGEPEEADPAEVERLKQEMLANAANELLAPVSEDEMRQRVDELPGRIERLDAYAGEVADRVAPTEDDMPRDPADFTPDPSFGTVIESENKMISVRVMAGFIGEVTIKESWLATRSGIAVTECFDQIIEQLPEGAAADTPNPGA